MGNQSDAILEFWEEIGPKGWYVADDALDNQIRDRFLSSWEAARDGKYKDWVTRPESTLAYIILVDQFPRNMFRGHANSFATDRLARWASKRAIVRDFDTHFEGGIRQFFYLPLMHSESNVDQDSGVRAFITRMPNEQILRHARAHRQVIREFGRFPYRNDALGRETTPAEAAYLKAGGYGYTVDNLPD